MTTQPSRPSRPLVLGHRGMRGAPENTMPAFERALAVGADGVELDVRCCKSGEIVVFHDLDLQRMAQRPERIAEVDYAFLQTLDLGDGARIPLLAEVVARTTRSGKHLNVEIKGDAPSIDPVVHGVAKQLAQLTAADRARVIVSSFSPRVLERFRKLDATTRLAFLYEDVAGAALAPQLASLGAHPRHTLLDATSLAALRAHASFVNTWTVNDAARAAQLVALGVDAIITDVPDVILATLSAASR